MKIQYIRFYGMNNLDKRIKLSNISAPVSPDEFDINIIDLNDSQFWTYFFFAREMGKVDVAHFARMVSNSKKTIFVLFYPSNLPLFDTLSGRLNQIQIKDKTEAVNSIVSLIFPWFHDLEIYYEPNKTRTGTGVFYSDFCAGFGPSSIIRDEINGKRIVSDAEKTIIISKERMIATTLSVEANRIYEFLSLLELYTEEEELPQWLKDYSFYNDQENRDEITKNSSEIQKAQKNINRAEDILSSNNEYKSILISNGDQLVMMVFKILEQILACKLSGFKDEKKEDFNIEIGDVVFVGEIKGENGGVKNSHISQLGTHIDIYKEDFPDKKNVKGLLIINHQRSKEITFREKVNPSQIQKANRDSILIIETLELLLLFERFLKHEICSDQCVAVFRDSSGLFKAEHVKSS